MATVGLSAAAPALAWRRRLFAPWQIARFARLHSRKPSMRALFLVIDLALELYIWIVIAAAIFSWLIAFHVVNTRNQVVAMIGESLYRITEPVLRPIRNMLPNLGGIDISPVILFLIIIFIRYVIALYILPNVY
jgi:YggT family protein